MGAARKSDDTGRSWGARLVVLVPYLWLVAFFLVPFLIVLQDQPVADRDRAAALYARCSISPPAGRA